MTRSLVVVRGGTCGQSRLASQTHYSGRRSAKSADPGISSAPAANFLRCVAGRPVADRESEVPASH